MIYLSFLIHCSSHKSIFTVDELVKHVPLSVNIENNEFQMTEETCSLMWQQIFGSLELHIFHISVFYAREGKGRGKCG